MKAFESSFNYSVTTFLALRQSPPVVQRYSTPKLAGFAHTPFYDVNECETHNKVITQIINMYSDIYLKIIKKILKNEPIEKQTRSKILQVLNLIKEKLRIYIYGNPEEVSNVKRELLSSRSGVIEKSKTLDPLFETVITKIALTVHKEKFAVYKGEFLEEITELNWNQVLNIFYYQDSTFIKNIDTLTEKLNKVDEKILKSSFITAKRVKNIYLKYDILREILELVETGKIEGSDNVKWFLREILKTEEILNKIVDQNFKSPAEREFTIIYFSFFADRVLNFIEVDPNLRVLAEQEFDVEERDEEDFAKPLLGKISVGDRILTLAEIWERLIEHKESKIQGKKRRILDMTEEEIKEEIETIKEQIVRYFGGIDIIGLIQPLYPEREDSKQPLIEELGRVFKQYLELSALDKEKDTKIKSVKYKSKEMFLKIKERKILIDEKPIIFIIYPENSKEQAITIKNTIERKRVPYTHLWIEKVFLLPIEIIFPDFLRLIEYFGKDESKKIWKNIVIESSTERINFSIINLLLQTLAFGYSLERLENEVEKTCASFLLVEDRYRFIDSLRDLRSKAAIPIQVLDMSERGFGKQFSRDGINAGALKNAFFSLFKDLKELTFNADGLLLDEVLKIPFSRVELIVEDKGNSLFSLDIMELRKKSRYPYYYEQFHITRQGKELRMKRVFADLPDYAISEDTPVLFENLRTHLEKKASSETEKIYRFLIVYDPLNSPLLELVSQDDSQNTLIGYYGIKIPSGFEPPPQKPKTKDDKHQKYQKMSGVLIYPQSFERATELIGKPRFVTTNTRFSKGFFAIRFPIPELLLRQKEKFNHIINTELSLFMLERGKLERDYGLQSLMLVSVILWLSYKTESYDYLLSKPKFHEKKLFTLTVSKRASSTSSTTIHSYYFDGYTLNCELTYVYNKLFRRW